MKLKSLIPALIIGSILQTSVFAQENSQKKISFVLSGGLSFFGPSGVNKYIKEYLDSKSITVQAGFSDIIMNLNAKLGLKYLVNENLGLSGVLDFAIAPKYISVANGSSESFSFNRVSPGVICDYYIGSASGNKYIVGAGIFDNFMTFKDFSASAIGVRLQAGKNIKVGNNIVNLLFVVNLMPSVSATNAGESIDLNYTDFGICLGFEF
jgi:outer membrane protein W